MSKIFKGKRVSKENDETAPWANAEKTTPDNINIPSEREVYNAKKWVDTNEK